jgi:Fe-S cluster biosynthesis and repair protein YggX/DNA-binding SARP family transcriptional activator
MDITARIAQFENMTQADPTNEMAHFSLARAYAEAGRSADAARSFLRCVELVPDMSKAYQLAGEQLIKAGDTTKAAAVLTQGYIVAAGKGDFMPKTAMGTLLKQINAEVPEVAGAKTETAAQVIDDGSGNIPPGMMRCRRTGKLGSPMKQPPFRGPEGAWIAANITQETWTAWIGQGTKVINEMRLDLSRDKDLETYDQHMREYLGIDETVQAEIQQLSKA